MKLRILGRELMFHFDAYLFIGFFHFVFLFFDRSILNEPKCLMPGKKGPIPHSFINIIGTMNWMRKNWAHATNLPINMNTVDEQKLTNQQQNH